MPSSFSPTELTPANGSSTSPDSPGPVSGEDQNSITPPVWLPGNSVWQFGDLLGDLQKITTTVASDITGSAPATSSNVVLPASPSAYYLVRFYSGGTGDINEMPFVSGGADSIYDGPELWRSAMVNNDISVAVDLINATNLIPPKIVSCETDDLLPQIPTIVSDIGTSNQGWSTFQQVSGTVWGSFTSNFGSCSSSNALGNVLGMLADAVKLGSSSIIDGINSVSQASDAIQIVTEQEFESPVDTALIQVVAPSSGSVANITFSPSALQISVGGTGTITATAYDSSNNAISDASLNWSIGNPAIATLSASGNTVQVKGTSAGTTELTATAGSGFTAFVPVTVSATSSGPTVGGVSPNPVPPTNSNQTLTINGSNFQSGATLTYYDTNGKASPGHTAAFVSSSQLVDSAFDDASDVGVWKVVVVNPNSTSSAAFAFNVSASTSAPTVSSVSPNPVPPSNTAQTLTINGSNFQSGATLTYYDTSGNIYAGRTATFVSSSQLIDPAFDDANDSGTWKVVVVNPGGTSSAASSFTVAASSSNPSLSGLSTSPNPPVAGQQFTLTLNGSNFDPSTVQILISGPGCSSCAVANAVLTTKTATQVISAVTLNSPGSYTVTVENGASGTPSNSLPLTVGGVTPSLSGLSTSPNPPVAGQQFTLTLNGSNFNPNSVQVLIGGGTCGGCIISNGMLTTKTSTQIVAPVTLSSSGSYNITVQNGAGGGQSNALTLVLGSPTPSLTALVTSPTSPAAGQQFTIDISGTNFDPSTAQILFNGPGCAPCTLPTSNLTTTNATLLIGSTTLSTAGSYTVTVENGASGTPSNSLPLTIGSGSPSISSVSPNPVPSSNSAQQLTINGSNFQSGATLTYYDTNGTAYPGHTATFVSSSQLVDPAFDDASDSGTWQVVVVNPGGTSSAVYSFSVQ